MSRGPSVLACLLAGGCIALSMPPWGWWPLAFVGFGLLAELLTVPGRRARAWRGWLTGIGWIVPSTAWMIDFSLPGYVAAGVILSGYVAGAAVVVPPQGPWRWLALPGAVAVVECVRTTVPFGGVPLSTVAMSQAASPLAVVARVGGTTGLTLVTVAVAMALVALVRRRWRPAAIGAGALAAAVLLTVAAPTGEVLGPLDVALVQGGGPQRTRAVETDAAVVFDRHLAASERVEPGAELVLWPENVVSVDGPLTGTAEERELLALARRLGATVVPGIVESFPGFFYNASVVITPDGRTASRYDKVRRVPFGEYVPFRGVLDALTGGMVSRFVPNDAVAGKGPAVLDTPSGRMGVVISWEVFFERRARDAIANGGEVLLNPTNGSSYWLTIVQSQQVASSRLRAIETGRWVLQAAPTGFSAVIAPDGTVQQRSGISEAAVLQQTVERRTGLTWPVRFGPWPALVLAAGLVVAANGSAARRRPAGEPTQPSATVEPVPLETATPGP